jgi:CHASE3 domain sensor protein
MSRLSVPRPGVLRAEPALVATADQAVGPSIVRRARTLLLLPMVLLLAGALASTSATATTRHSDQVITDVLAPGQVAVEELDAAYLGQLSAARGYVLTGQPIFLEPFRDAAPVIAAAVARLQVATASDPGASAALDAVTASHRTWIERANQILAQHDRGDAAGAVAAAPSGSRLFADLQIRVDSLRGAVGALVARARHDAAWAGSIAILTSAATLVLGAALAAISLVLLRRRVTAPLEDLQQRVSAIRPDGDGPPVPATGPAEIAAVGAAVTRLRDRLTEHHHTQIAHQLQLARLDEAERIAHQQRRTVMRRIFGVGLTLHALADLHPDIAPRLSEASGDLDAAIADLRDSALNERRGGAEPTRQAAGDADADGGPEPHPTSPQPRPNADDDPVSA